MKELLSNVDPTNVLWLLMALLFGFMLYRFQAKNPNFDIADMFMNQSLRPPKADLTSIIIFMMALMAIWVCVQRSVKDKDVDNLVLGVLTIFVIRQAFKIGADAYSAKPPPPEPPEPPPPTQQNVTVNPTPPAITPPPPIPPRAPPVNPLAKKRTR